MLRLAQLMLFVMILMTNVCHHCLLQGGIMLRLSHSMLFVMILMTSVCYHCLSQNGSMLRLSQVMYFVMILMTNICSHCVLQEIQRCADKIRYNSPLRPHMDTVLSKVGSQKRVPAPLYWCFSE